jgi:pyrroloquinoline quinone biosynthesis protein B
VIAGPALAALAVGAAGAGLGGQAAGRPGGQHVPTAPAAHAFVPAPADTVPFLVVLGIAQDGGVPQAGGPDRGIERLVVSLALVDPTSGERWLFEATPDFRVQLAALDAMAPAEDPAPGLAGIFLTHPHMGHYTGLMFLGHESMGSAGVPVYVPPRFAAYLANNGPWSQLVRYDNIDVRVQEPGATVQLNDRLSVTSFRVPHREEFGEVVGYRIDGPNRRVLFIPDIDGWDEWDAAGMRLEEQLALVDVAYLDGSFFDDGEIPGRDMSGFPHPRIRETMNRLQALPDSERTKVRFIHLNHTNPALDPDGNTRQEIEQRGFHVANEGERIAL